MKKRWGVRAAAGFLILGCSLLQPGNKAWPSTAALRPTKAAASGSNRALEGSWRVFYSWGCGSDSKAVWILRADGTFFSPEAGGGGTWRLDGADFRLSFDYSPHTTYLGKVDSALDSMEGTMESDDGKEGCWRATRESTTPSVGETRASSPAQKTATR